MEVSVKTTSGLEREMTVSIPSDRIESEVAARVAKAAKSARIDGFRKGKVPLAIIRQRFGAGIRQEVLSDLINQTYGQALQQNKVRPAGNPRIEPFEADSSEGFHYKAVFEVYPEVKLADLSKLKLEKMTASISDSEVDEMIANLRSQSASWKAVDRAAREGDQVGLHYQGSIDGELFEGGSAKNQKIEIGAGRMIPGFEEGLVGLKSGDTKELEVTFPDDYHAADLQGKVAVFAIEVVTVAEKELPELDDDFAKRFGIEEGGVDGLRAGVRDEMQTELDRAQRNVLKNVVMKALADAHDMELPKAAVHEEIHRMKHEMADQYRQQKLDPHSLPNELFQERAEMRVKLGLLVSEVLRSAEIKLDDAQVKDEIRRQAAGYERPEEVEKYFLGNQELLNSIQMRVLEDQVVTHILGVAEVSEKESSYKAIIAAQSQG